VVQRISGRGAENPFGDLVARDLGGVAAIDMEPDAQVGRATLFLVR
jgi:hypothetical protein